jgi:hypothetical protein
MARKYMNDIHNYKRTLERIIERIEKWVKEAYTRENSAKN